MGDPKTQEIKQPDITQTGVNQLMWTTVCINPILHLLAKDFMASSCKIGFIPGLIARTTSEDWVCKKEEPQLQQAGTHQCHETVSSTHRA